MNKNELINAISEKAEISKKDAAVALNATVDAITAALTSGDKVHLPGFGTFEAKHRKARTGRNPRTKETIEIPATNIPAFKPAKALKEKIG